MKYESKVGAGESPDDIPFSSLFHPSHETDLGLRFTHLDLFTICVYLGDSDATHAGP